VVIRIIFTFFGFPFANEIFVTMKNSILFLFLLSILGDSCSSAIPKVFGKKSAHEKHADDLDKRDLDKTPAGRQWLAASKTALELPQSIALPYKQKGFFDNDKPRALGLKFTAIQGEKLSFTITKKNTSSFVLYVDLFKEDANGHSILHAADTASAPFSFDIEGSGNYVLRLQPQLFATGEYTLSVSVGPSLLFPVVGKSAKTGSYWGASRDGGKRSHEGIDIFAPKLTPVLAGADGIITGVGEGGIGGKVVWLHPVNKKYTLYYAHLDRQLVQEDQAVKKGDTLGLVGNTGNAKNTAPHLHFGIYGSSGAVDPFPFVNPAIKTAAAVPEKNLRTYLRLLKAQQLGNEMAKANTVMVPLAINIKGYIAELPNGMQVQVPFTAVKAVPQTAKAEASVVRKTNEGNTF
jgi:murein DD-endopeptidase MepM/ murein hydrolase activator NlpD